MFNKEKPKGLPGARGIGYLVTGIVIGVVGVLGVMFFLTLPACACKQPIATHTSLPSIPTPVPGVTGTAAAQSQSLQIQPLHLTGFHVNETKGEIALSYYDATTGTFEVRAWDGTEVGQTSTVLRQGTRESTQYSTIQFHPTTSQILASEAGFGTYFFDPTTQTNTGIVSAAAYSPDGEWTAVWSVASVRIQSSVSPSVWEADIRGLSVSDAAISSDGSRIAVVGAVADRNDQYEIRVFSTPTLKLLQTSTFSVNGVGDADILFMPDQMTLIVREREGIHVLNPSTGTHRYFDVVNSDAMVLDPSGQWLAVTIWAMGSEPSQSVWSLRLYDLAATSYIPPEGSEPQVIADAMIAQFLIDGSLLVGNNDATITRYHWTGQMWDSPTVVMTAADLE